MNYSNLELASVHTDVLYVHNRSDRLLRINEPDPDGPAPRFFLFRTLSGNVWRARYDLPGDISHELEKLAGEEPVAEEQNGLREPPYHLPRYLELLERRTPDDSLEVDSGPASYLPELHPPMGTHAATVTITAENAALLEPHFPYTREMHAEHAPVVARVVDGIAVAVCSSARITARAAEAGVHTVEAYRGRGYGVEVVRGWAEAVRASGRLPLYSTSWDNTASQAVAGKLGAVLYGVDFSIT
jgi:RimJ/RimL family protein N-acetyltransferase